MSQEVIEITEREIEVIEVVEKGPLGPIGPVGPQANINYTVVTANQTLSNSQNIAADTSGGSFTLTLPASPNAGDSIDIFDYANTFDTNPLTIARNGQNIESLAEDLTANIEGAYFTLIYTGSTRGWQILPRYGVSGIEDVLSAEGDLLYRGASSETRLPIGTAGQVLKVNSGATAPEWGSISGSISVTGSDLTLSGATGTAITNATIANDAVTNAKLSNMATATIKGRATASTGDPEDLSASQVRTILNVADGAEVNVNADWDAVSGDAQILNKPATFTPSSHTHGNITNDGKVGSTSGLPVVTTTAGAVTTLALGTANQVLRVNSGATGVEFGAGFDAASPPAIGNTTPAAGSFTTLTANNGTLTASAPVLDLAQTWNNAAVTFTGLRFAVTNTASNTASLIQNLSVGGTSVVETNVRGRTTFRRLGSLDYSNIVEFRLGSTLLANIRDDGAVNFSNNCTGAGCTMHNQEVRVGSGGAFGFTSVNNEPFGTTDIFLRRDAANTLAQRNGTDAQNFRLYNTFTSATNHERGFLKWSSNVFQIGTEKGSGGGTARALVFQTDGVTRMTIAANGDVSCATPATFNHNVTITQGGRQLGVTTIAGTNTMTLNSGGVIRWSTTNAFPSLRHSGTTLQVRLADDTAFTALQAGNLVLTDNTGSETATFDAQGKLTANRTYDLPDASGTLALLETLPAELVIACSDETSNLTTGTAKVTFRMPYAMTLSSVRASVNTAPTGSTLIVDINEGGSTILSTKLSIDASELTSTTAATAAVISDTALADDAEVTIDIDQIGSTIAGKGLKVVLKGVRA
jgi:hypothetical protein